MELFWHPVSANAVQEVCLGLSSFLGFPLSQIIRRNCTSADLCLDNVLLLANRAKLGYYFQFGLEWDIEMKGSGPLGLELTVYFLSGEASSTGDRYSNVC